MPPRLEVALGCFDDAGDHAEPKSRHQRVLDVISDPSVRKILIMRWWELEEIGAAEAEALIRDNGLESA